MVEATIRLPVKTLESWKDACLANRAVKGVEPVSKEMLDALLRQGHDGSVEIARHQVFSWAEALRGAATRAEAQAEQALHAVATEMTNALHTAPAAAPQAAAAPTPLAQSASSVEPVTYQKSWVASEATASAAPGAMRLVTEREIPQLQAQLLRDARSEVIVVAPWNGGLDTMGRDLTALPPSVALRIITRRAQVEDEVWYRAIQELRRRNADVVMSPLLHTRCILVDGKTMLLGAAGTPPQLSKEMALLVTDPALVTEARLNIGRLWAEARDGR